MNYFKMSHSIIFLLLFIMFMSAVECYKNNQVSSNTLNSYNFYYPGSEVSTRI